GLPKHQDPGHWWSSFFFGKHNQPTMTTLTESPQNSGTFSVTNEKVTCGLAQEVMKRQLSDASESGKPEAGSSA
ncbi:PDPFB factor, partial [Atractosteus spatula]|nr:PDPFB factor [Atractosteus spatula]